VLERAQEKGAIDRGHTNAVDAVHGSDVVVPGDSGGSDHRSDRTTRPGACGKQSAHRCGKHEGRGGGACDEGFKKAADSGFWRASDGGKEQAGVEFADADLFQGGVVFYSPRRAGHLPWSKRRVSGVGREDRCEDRRSGCCRTRSIVCLDQPFAADDCNALAASLVDQFGAALTLDEAAASSGATPASSKDAAPNWSTSEAASAVAIICGKWLIQAHN